MPLLIENAITAAEQRAASERIPMAVYLPRGVAEWRVCKQNEIEPDACQRLFHVFPDGALAKVRTD